MGRWRRIHASLAVCSSSNFTRTFSAMQYRFRAVIHADPDFPYAAGTSPVVKVVVRP